MDSLKLIVLTIVRRASNQPAINGLNPFVPHFHEKKQTNETAYCRFGVPNTKEK